MNDKKVENEIKNENENVINNEEQEPFQVIVSENKKDNEIIITSANDLSKWYNNALKQYSPDNHAYTAYISDFSNITKISIDDLDNLSENTQNDVNKVNKINKIIRKYVNKDDIIGKVYESITSNVNSKIKISYNKIDGKNKNSKLKEVKSIVQAFNKQININQLIKESIPMTYIEGNYVIYLKHVGEKNGHNFGIITFPLGIVEVSPYYNCMTREPILLVNMDKFKESLSANVQVKDIKTKKGQKIFFEKLEQEIQNSYPTEIYEAYINKEQYAKLDSRFTGIIRINNLGRQYGVSSVFRALKPTLMLEIIGKADEITAKTKAKKIIHQMTDINILKNGDNYSLDKLDLVAYAHESLMQAFKQNTVLYTSHPIVNDLRYVEPTVEDITPEKINLYRSEVLSTLGITFLTSDKSTTAGMAHINLSQLMKTINSISEQLKIILEKWYTYLLCEDYNYGYEFVPEVTIIDSEQMAIDVRQSLASLLFSQFNCSYGTTLEMLGIDVLDEIEKLKEEHERGYKDMFLPHATANNSSGNNDDSSDDSNGANNADDNAKEANGKISKDGKVNRGGRKKSQKDQDRAIYDEDYNKNNR